MSTRELAEPAGLVAAATAEVADAGVAWVSVFTVGHFLAAHASQRMRWIGAARVQEVPQTMGRPQVRDGALSGRPALQNKSYR